MPTKLIIGMIVRDEEAMLRQTLPRISPFVDGIVAVDAESRDGTFDLLIAIGASVLRRKWEGDFTKARNRCIELSESFCKSPTHILMLDADEAITARDFASLRTAIDSDPDCAFALPRYEFVDDLYHFNPSFYPDYQARCFPLHSGFHYRGALHEQLFRNTETQTAFQSGSCVPLPYIHIFHYGKCKPLADVWLKYENYRRFNSGEPPLASVPSGTKLPSTFSSGPRLFFHGERPL